LCVSSLNHRRPQRHRQKVKNVIELLVNEGALAVMVGTAATGILTPAFVPVDVPVAGTNEKRSA
jgi:hypothetical protein